MSSLLLDFLDNTFNYKKLKRSRLKRKLTLADVSEKTGIPVATLQRYEDGLTKKIPLEAIKKICQVYNVDYNFYYSWTALPFFSTLSGALLSLFYGVSITSIHAGTAIGGFLGLTGMVGIEKLYSKLKDEEKNYKQVVYNSLEKEEQKEYQDFKTIATTLLKTNEILDDIEKEEADNLMFTLYLLHKIRKVSKRKNIDIQDIEILDKNQQ